MPTFVLVHSPLVGPLTWQPVAAELRNRGFGAVVPALPDARTIAPPYWQRHAEAVIAKLETIPLSEPIILAAHSGAGQLLPAIRMVSQRPLAGYMFVDAGIPQNGKSRLAAFAVDEADEFRARAIGGSIPTWTVDDLAEVTPDAELRRRFVAELYPLPLAVYEEPLPVFSGWPDAPGAYLQLSNFYRPYAEQARAQNWPCRVIAAAHFHMLVDPAAVASAMIDLAEQMGLCR